ncbi:putative molybdenum cofactor sulfurtransferase [Helianthus anomalus]
MGRNVEEQIILQQQSKEMDETDFGKSLLASLPNSPNQNNGSRPTSMVMKKAHTVFPAHLVAEAISTLHGLDLRWSGPITPQEMEYVKQYIFAKYPEYCNGLIVEEGDKIDLYNICSNNESTMEASISDDKRKYSPRVITIKDSSSPSSFSSISDLDGTQLAPSKLLEILNKKSSFEGNFMSIPEIQARNKALQNCGLQEDEYLVIFTPTCKEAMVMIGESYPFFRGNYYMTIINEKEDSIREFVTNKDSKVIAAPESWLDLRIKGSQLSQYFRRKNKYSPKGLFAYPAYVNGTSYSMHWISEAHRNSWHVLLDATELEPTKERLTLALHRPDFVICTVNNTHAQPSKINCLLVRRKSFETPQPLTSDS